MKPVKAGDRVVVNIQEAEYVPFVMESGETSGSVLQLDDSKRPGVGFHIYHMPPGCRTTPHEHAGDEHFYVISGEMVDNDGTVYRPGDLVLMKKGSQHYGYTERGCTMVVYIETPETAV